MKTPKQKVLVLALYDNKDIDKWIKQEESLKKYCKDKNYEVLDIIRSSKPYALFPLAENIMELMNQYLFDGLNRIVIYDIKNFVSDNSSLLTILMLLKEGQVILDAILQGPLKFNPYYEEDFLNDDYFFEHSIYLKNRKYYVDFNLD